MAPPKKVRYTHDAMIDVLLAEPGIKQGELARHFGYTEAWVSTVMNSDAFKARLELQRERLIDPTIAASLDERIAALANKSAEKLLERVIIDDSPDIALEAFKVSTKAMGYGARPNNIGMQQNFVVALPQKSTSAEEWSTEHKPTEPPTVIDVPVQV